MFFFFIPMWKLWIHSGPPNFPSSLLYFFFRIDVKWVLNWIYDGLSNVLKSLKFGLLRPAEAPVSRWTHYTVKVRCLVENSALKLSLHNMKFGWHVFLPKTHKSKTKLFCFETATLGSIWQISRVLQKPMTQTCRFKVASHKAKDTFFFKLIA